MNIHLSEVMNYYLTIYHTHHNEVVKYIFFGQMQVKVYPCIEICRNRHRFSFILGIQDKFTLAHMKMKFLSFSVNEMCRKL